MGSHYLYVRGQQEQQGIDTGESIDVLNQTFRYMKQLLNDLDVLVNNGKGETFGALYQLNGERMIEIEKYAYGEQGFPDELKDYSAQRFE